MKEGGSREGVRGCFCAAAGVQVCEGVSVEGVDVKEGRVTGVKTDSGDIQCEMFVNCGGQVCVCVCVCVVSLVLSVSACSGRVRWA